MQQLDPKAIWLFFIGLILRWFILLIFLFFWFSLFFGVFFATAGQLSLGPLKWLWIIIPVFLVFFWIWAKLTYRFYRYELREDGFRKEYGVIRKKYVTIPYDRIQNVDIYRGLIARILGLSELSVQTAGATQVSRGSGAEGKLPGLSHEIAEQVRDNLVKYARQSRTINQGL